MTGQFSEDNSIKLMTMMTEAFAGDDIDLKFYFGAVSTLVLERYQMEDIGFGCHHFSLYSYSNYEAPDALIIVFGSINVGQKQPMDIHDFIRYLPRVPLILLKENAELPENPGSISVNMDNYAGMKECVLHLIREHQRKKIGYVSGPPTHSDSRLRLSAYRDALEETGLSFEESYVVYGDYQSHVDAEVEELFDRHPDLDAVVSANDEMATAVYRVAEKRGRTIGKDLAVTGFDNIAIAAYMDPPLTTVYQDYSKIAVAAAGKVRELLSGKTIRSELLPADFILRSSCGCVQKEIREEKQEKKQGENAFLMSNWMQVNQMQMNAMVLTLILRELQMNSASKKEFFEHLARQMIHLKLQSSFVCLLEEPVVLQDGEMLKAPEKLLLYMRQDGENYTAYEDEDAVEIRFGEMSNLVRDTGDPVHMTNFILFHERTQYGLISMEIEPKDVLFFETLALEIGSALYSLHMFLREQELRRDLEKKNEILDYAASHDQLTGILNRTGIMSQISKFIRNRNKEEDAELMLVMADLDHLKQINDNFGHHEGDSAICTAADILKKTLPEGSPLGRTGGDEFTAIMKYRSDEDIQQFEADIKQNCAEYNAHSGKKYYVNLSVGMCPLKLGGRDRILLTVIQKADEKLYEAKKRRLKSVLREQS